MITNNRKPTWFFYPAWVVLSSLSIPIAFGFYWALASLANQVVGSTILVRGQSHITEDFLLPYFLAPVLGLAFGLAQGRQQPGRVPGRAASQLLAFEQEDILPSEFS